MAGKWIKLKNADGKSEVRYREHETRKYGKMPERYYVLTYWYKNKTATEAIGWASENWTPTACFEPKAILKHNQSTGNGPCTLSEMREIEDAKKEADRKAEATEKRQSFKAFFYDIFAGSPHKVEKTNHR